jgi:thiol-disulfide isomerase/thioredoxin
MNCVALSALLVSFLVPLTAFAGGGKDTVKPGSVDEQFLTLRKEYIAAIKGAEGNDEKKNKIAADYAPKFFGLATKHAKDEGAADALLWILINAPQSSELPRAVKLLEKEYLQSSRLKPKLQAAHFPEAAETERFLRSVMEKNTDNDTQGLACFALAQMLKDKAGDDNQKLRNDAMGLFDLCVTKYADCPLLNKATVGQRARPLLFEMRNLAIGKVVPDIVGEDLDGNKLKLSDYRGRVVMLDFWATWCPHCMKMVPSERALVKRLEGHPFVLIGVSGDRGGERKNVLLRVEKEQITWRTFWDGNGAIAGKWNIEYWPTIFIIDHNGVIRHRMNVSSAEDLDRAIDPLIATARKAAGKKATAK